VKKKKRLLEKKKKKKKKKKKRPAHPVPGKPGSIDAAWHML
jgi:hypothetical protein